VAQVSTSADAPATGPAAPALDSTSASGRIGLSDAVAMLKMIARHPVPTPAVDIRRSVAADVNDDGSVILGDVLAVLRHAVGVQTVAPDWVTFDRADPAFAARPPLQPGRVWAPDALIQDLFPSGLELVSVLRGDVDGSVRRSAHGVDDAWCPVRSACACLPPRELSVVRPTVAPISTSFWIFHGYDRRCKKRGM
jgi:hypothetical protein